MHMFDVSHSTLHMHVLHSQYYIVTGIEEGGVFKYTANLRKSIGTQVGVVELGIDKIKHVELVEVGEVRDVPLTTPVSGQSAQAGTQGIVPMTSGTHSVSYRTSWYDPIGIEVNHVQDNLTFSFDGISVYGISGSDDRWWLSNDGWAEIQHTLNVVYWNDGTGRAITYDVMRNYPFCGNNDTTVTYDVNQALGYSNGDVGGLIRTYDSGLCGGLLHYESNFA